MCCSNAPPQLRVTPRRRFWLSGCGIWSTFGTAVPRAVLRLSWRGALPVRLVHAWTGGERDAALVVEPRIGDEIRLDLVRGADVETGYVPAGQPA